MPGLRRFALAGSEEGDQLEQRERLAHDARQPRLARAELGAHGGRVLVVELAELGLDARRKRHRARTLGRGVRGDLRRHVQVALIDVGHEQDRLGRQ